MQSIKSTHKKPFETINTYEECTWLGNDTPIYESEVCAIFKDRYPVTKGHLLFVPKSNDTETIGETYKLAYEHGQEGIAEGKWTGYNLGQNLGKSAGQSIFWPHIHLIPRHDGDSDPEKHNGVRLAHPGGDHTNYY